MKPSFEELGRAADQGVRNVANAKRTVIEAGAGMFDMVSVDIRGADWQNGLFYLREHLTAVVRENLPDLMTAAVKRMEEQSKAGLDALRLAFQGGDMPEGEEPRQVPRQVSDASHGLPDAQRVAEAGTGFTTEQQKAEHEASQAATPPAGSAYAAGTAAPSGPTGRTDPVSTTLRLQPADFAGSWKLEGASFETGREEAELFEHVFSGNARVPARGPVAGALVNKGLLEKSDKSAQAVLRLTPKGEKWADTIRQSKAGK